MNELAVQSDSLSGTWEGSLDAGQGMKMPLVFKFSAEADGKLSGWLQSPAQSLQTMDFDHVTCDADGHVLAEIAKIKARFQGKLLSDQKNLAGTWLQLGVPYPLQLSRSSGYKPPHRPQEPVKPFPYAEELVSFESAGNHIAGTLTLPSLQGKFPAAILICGSGPNNRDEQIFFHKPFMVIADYLTRHGIAVLRYDKRGIGKSSGSYANATSMDFAEDALSALKFLKTQEHIDAKNIGLIGHSEGGVVAPIVASRDPDLCYIVSMAGSVLPGDQILLGQVEALGRTAGISQKELDASLQRARQSYEIVKTEPDNKKALEKLRLLNMQAQAAETNASSTEKSANSATTLNKLATTIDARDLSADTDKHGKEDQALEMKLAVLTSPWYRFFISFDPRTVWSKVKCPVFALNGDKDLQVIADENLGAMRKSLAEGGNSKLTVQTVHGVNHLFQTCNSGLPSEYASIEETFSPAVLELIKKWISEQVAK